MKYKQDEMIFREIKPNFFVAEFPGKNTTYNELFTKFGKYETRKIEINFLITKIIFIFPDIFFYDYGYSREYFIPLADIVRQDGSVITTSDCHRHSSQLDANNICEYLNRLEYKSICTNLKFYFGGFDYVYIPVWRYGSNNHIYVSLRIDDLMKSDNPEMLLPLFNDLYGFPMRIYSLSRHKSGKNIAFYINDTLCVKIFHYEHNMAIVYKARDFLQATAERNDINVNCISEAVPNILYMLSRRLEEKRIKFRKGVFKELYTQSRILKHVDGMERYYIALSDFMAFLISKKITI